MLTPYRLCDLAGHETRRAILNLAASGLSLFPQRKASKWRSFA